MQAGLASKILALEKQQIPDRWSEEYRLSELRGKTHNFGIGKRREMLRNHFEHLDTVSRGVVKYNPTSNQHRDVMHNFSRGVMAYTEQRYMNRPFYVQKMTSPFMHWSEQLHNSLHRDDPSRYDYFNLKVIFQYLD